MTREEAKKRLEVRLICANCPEDKMCYDSHLHSICEYTDYCDEVPIEEAVKVAIEALEQEPCDKCVYSTSEGCQYDDITETIPPFEDCISRQAVLDVTWEEPSYTDALNVLTEVRDKVKALPPVNPPFDDCISRQAVLDSIHANCVYENEYNLTAKHIEDAVKQLPPVTPQLKTRQKVRDKE